MPSRVVEILEGKWVKEPISEVFGFWVLVSNLASDFGKFQGNVDMETRS